MDEELLPDDRSGPDDLVGRVKDRLPGLADDPYVGINYRDPDEREWLLVTDPETYAETLDAGGTIGKRFDRALFGRGSPAAEADEAGDRSVLDTVKDGISRVNPFGVEDPYVHDPYTGIVSKDPKKDELLYALDDVRDAGLTAGRVTLVEEGDEIGPLTIVAAGRDGERHAVSTHLDVGDRSVLTHGVATAEQVEQAEEGMTALGIEEPSVVVNAPEERDESEGRRDRLLHEQESAAAEIESEPEQGEDQRTL